MTMALIGGWGEPLSATRYREVIAQTVKRFDCCCGFCGVRMPQTANQPFAGLQACPIEDGLSPELANLVPLCPVCVRFNNLEKLKGCGQFVELPWLSQGQLTNLLRFFYCAQASTDANVRKSRIYLASNSVLQELARTPSSWGEFHFDGSVERVMDAVKGHTGYIEGKADKPLYIDRLRFLWRPEPFKEAITFWSPTIETQLLNAEYRDAGYEPLEEVSES
ncbi:HNH endonuclease signature motif containing protein [Marinimicrobium sp. ABcell2]|uniref:HNH endonuclease signature motif containing protein n=1 Tax=Marinimicrobium sp. ABcell2 TaxID=3069751 RepID=UPI0027B15681|nr:HNH endonuclease signature motif containing protein [Marinimicrobium sp. ABcell2]MDQ2077394.1 HNH endonuclease signature motif containing protein [Marinimicrobium sp. ABcell2]